jgi:hypothetical protein
VGAWRQGWRLSYADAFALAYSEAQGVPLVTTDHGEFDPIDQAGAARFFWLR